MNLAWAIVCIVRTRTSLFMAKLAVLLIAYDLLHKSHIAPVPYLTMHHFVTEMCTFLLWSDALWDICLMHFGICEVGLIDMDNIDKYWHLCPYFFSTHLPLNKMAAILAEYIFKCIFLNEKFCILIRISLKFVPRSPVYNKPALVQEIAWRWIGDKQLPEPMLIQFIDAYMRH